MKSLFPQSFKNIYHLGQAILANIFFGFPGRKIRVIGVTGTNGKTTTVQMVAKILEAGGNKVALASTINFRIGDKEWVNATKMTTLSSFRVQRFLYQAVKQGCSWAVLEVSSHSLDQNRVWGIPFEIAIITNITREHLDYHETMEKYRKAKLGLFERTRTAVINLDISDSEEFLNENLDKAYFYTASDKESKIKIMVVRARDIQLSSDGSSFKVKNEEWEEEFKLNIPGKFNVENALSAICVGISQNIRIGDIAKALESIKVVPGRMEKIPNDLGIDIIVDYAVTPDSLEKLYEYLSGIKKEGSNIISVFGSCGERDRGKRPIMGRVVSKSADFVIITNEDPYGENPVEIINQVFSGVVGVEVKGELPNFQFPISNFQTISNDKISNDKKVEGKNAWRIFDRREAIKQALSLAKPGDMVIITGKGAEEIMAVGKERIPWNDKKVILEEIEKINPVTRE